uniref:Uncharacterized protein n=1 Tax=Arundo donax TaxID=35708 RepID=A0A0A9D3W2_ARUDO
MEKAADVGRVQTLEVDKLMRHTSQECIMTENKSNCTKHVIVTMRLIQSLSFFTCQIMNFRVASCLGLLINREVTPLSNYFRCFFFAYISAMLCMMPY